MDKHVLKKLDPVRGKFTCNSAMRYKYNANSLYYPLITSNDSVSPPIVPTRQPLV